MPTQGNTIRFKIGKRAAKELEDLLDRQREEHPQAGRNCIWPTPQKSGWYIKLDLDDPAHRDSAEWLAQWLSTRLDGPLSYRWDRVMKSMLRRIVTKIQTGLRARAMGDLPEVG